MSHLDGISLANKKNRVGKSKLETEIHQINREERIAIRMHNNAKQRFKNRYAKLDVFNDSHGKEASDIIMYETHNPGFCYRRNGDCRLPQSNITSHSVDMQDLHMLLFTNNEIDIEKVVCLHLLTAHRTETLSAPPKSQRTSFLTREQSPLERLIDRSKRKNFEVKLEQLPLYVIEIKNVIKFDRLRDPRIMSKVIINEKIVQIVRSVTKALEKSNLEKCRSFYNMVDDPNCIKEIIAKNRIQNFISNLIGQNLISSCESFTLIIPQRENLIPFEIDAPAFETLVRDIRKNILKIPSSLNWKSLDKLSITSQKLLKSGNTDNIIKESGISPNEPDIYKDPPNSTDVSYSVFAPSDEVVEFSLEYSGSSTTLASEYIGIGLQERPKIMRNAQEKGFSDIIVHSDEISETESRCSRSGSKIGSNLDFETLAALLSKKADKEAKLDYKELMEQEIIPEKTESVISHPIDGKCTLKQTKCNACMRKWQQPLPIPKMSKIKKLIMPDLKDSNYNFSSKSAQHISNLINEEVSKFDLAEKGNLPNTNNMISNRTFKSMARGSYVGNTSIEIVDLDELSLARIRQEIKENETKKKLEKFLNRK